MQDRIRALALEDVAERWRVADVHLMEPVPRMLARLGEGIEVARVREAVDVRDTMLSLADELSDERRSDEACAAGDEIRGHGRSKGV
jgi:hypothetical protein